MVPAGARRAAPQNRRGAESFSRKDAREEAVTSGGGERKLRLSIFSRNRFSDSAGESDHGDGMVPESYAPAGMAFRGVKDFLYQILHASVLGAAQNAQHAIEAKWVAVGIEGFRDAFREDYKQVAWFQGNRPLPVPGAMRQAEHGAVAFETDRAVLAFAKQQGGLMAGIEVAQLAPQRIDGSVEERSI